MKQKAFARMLPLWCALVLLFMTAAPAFASVCRHPLIDPAPVKEYVQPAANIKNILLLGIDKNDAVTEKGADYHTDAIMVLAINMDEQKVDMVSLPRDTLTYVPGIRGIYKLNAAINCGGGKTEQGFQTVCDAVSWVLGGIKIDHYGAVDLEAMAAIGDAIGGVDFELEMGYTGAHGTYRKGMQHLDGKGIVDYLRARRNATANSTDIGRTGRQRDLMFALFEKVKADRSLLTNVFYALQEMDHSFFTNMSIADMLGYLSMAVSMDAGRMGSYVISGPYRTALMNWNFTFTDQENRQAVIKQVYGVDVPELLHVSYQHTKWLVSDGFKAARYVAVAQALRGEIGQRDAALFTGEQKEAIAAFEAAYEQAAEAFCTAADSMAPEDTKAMTEASRLLREKGNAACALLEGMAQPAWTSTKYWYADRMINEVDVNFR